MTATPHFAPYFLNSCIADAQTDCTDSTRFLDAVYTNTGNSYITHAVLKFLGTDDGYLTPKNAMPNMASHRLTPQEAERITHEHTHILLGLQDHMRADWPETYFETALHNLKAIDLPTIVYSLGANSMGGLDRELHHKLSPVRIAFLKTLAERSKSIAIRGEYTAYVLANLGITNVTITGCPSFYLRREAASFPRPDWSIMKQVGATGTFSHPTQNNLLFYYLQDETLLGKILYFRDPLNTNDVQNFVRHFTGSHVHPAYWQSILKAAADKRVAWFSDMDAWQADIASRANFVIGTRVHGAIAALNAGVPAIVTNYDARAAEMCNLFGIPHYPMQFPPEQTLQAIYERYYDPARLQQRYAGLYARWRDWLERQGASIDCLAGHPTATHPQLQFNPPEMQLERLKVLVALYQQIVTQAPTRPTVLPDIKKAGTQ